MELILLSSVSQNSGGKNLIDSILSELYLCTCQRLLRQKSYGADDKTTRRQRVRLGDHLSNWKEISAAVRQASVLGPLIFNISINDLVYAVRQSTLSAFADDTQIFFADSTAEKVEEVINADIANVDKWYEQNGMKRNASKYQAIVMGKPQVKPQFYCENTCYSHYRRIGNAWCCCRR